MLMRLGATRQLHTPGRGTRLRDRARMAGVPVTAPDPTGRHDEAAEAYARAMAECQRQIEVCDFWTSDYEMSSNAFNASHHPRQCAVLHRANLATMREHAPMRFGPQREGEAPWECDQCSDPWPCAIWTRHAEPYREARPMNARHDAAMAENARRIEDHAKIAQACRDLGKVESEHWHARQLTIHTALGDILTRHAPFADGAHRTGYGCPWCLDGCGESTAWPCDDAEAALGCYETEAGE